jgi:hypothetical protein
MEPHYQVDCGLLLEIVKRHAICLLDMGDSDRSLPRDFFFLTTTPFANAMGFCF